MLINFTEKFKTSLKKIEKRNPRLKQQILKQLKLFKQNPHHPSLRNHKLKGNLQNNWSISVGKSFRLCFFEENGGFTFFDLGFHNEIYKK